MPLETFIRLRLSGRDARSATGQIEPTRLLDLFQDAATELCIRQAGDEGILRQYTNIEFFGSLQVGDFVEVVGRLTEAAGKTCTIELVAHKVIRAIRTVGAPLAGEVLDTPRLIARATGVWLVPPHAPARAATDVAEDDTDAPPSEPMSWGGHRPQDHPAPKRRPGPDVRLRETEPEPDARRPRSTGARPRDERDRDERPRARSERDWEPSRRPRDEDRGYGERPRGDRAMPDRPRAPRPSGGTRRK